MVLPRKTYFFSINEKKTLRDEILKKRLLYIRKAFANKAETRGLSYNKFEIEDLVFGKTNRQNKPSEIRKDSIILCHELETIFINEKMAVGRDDTPLAVKKADSYAMAIFMEEPCLRFEIACFRYVRNSPNEHIFNRSAV